MLDRYLDYTEAILPSLGRTRNWPIYQKHEFERIVLDHVFADSWYRHLRRSLRAHQQLSDTQLAQAVGIASRMAKSDAAEIQRMDADSQRWRSRPTPQANRRPHRLHGVMH